MMMSRHVGIKSTLPGGVPTTPADKLFTKDPDLGVVWGNHPDSTPEQREKLKGDVEQHKDTAFAYNVAQLGELCRLSRAIPH